MNTNFVFKKGSLLKHQRANKKQADATKKDTSSKGIMMGEFSDLTAFSSKAEP